jgi:hypothetical protein
LKKESIQALRDLIKDQGQVHPESDKEKDYRTELKENYLKEAKMRKYQHSMQDRSTISPK